MSEFSPAKDSLQHSGAAQGVRSSARDAAKDVSKTASDAFAKSSDALQDGASRLVDAGSAAADTMARNPKMATAIVSLGVGFLAGVMISRWT
jgi:ElaB/YqjD/DUF883 family membrane-anchored ribosome-binding protein